MSVPLKMMFVAACGAAVFSFVHGSPDVPEGLRNLRSEPTPTMAELSKPIMRRTKINAPACHTSEQFEKLASLTAEGDIEARNRYLAMRIKGGACRFIPQGTAVFMEESNLFGYPCVRVPGEIDCQYTSRALLEESAVAESAPPSVAKPGYTSSGRRILSFAPASR
jgi:hypothetical protein